MIFDNANIKAKHIKNTLFNKKEITLSILRLDTIHTVASGNKLFKLHYFLQDINKLNHNHIITFGGAYSNHLIATAYACKQLNIKATGIIRGEKNTHLSHTLQHCLDYGMGLKFISRADYNKKEQADFQQTLINELGAHLLIPEGGYHPLGAKGAELIMNSIDGDTTHICCAVGTATTIAGLLKAVKPTQKIVAVPVLKGMNDIIERCSFLLENNSFEDSLQILNNYHFGGYAKYTPQLIAFMNNIYKTYQLPTDFVYTAKMLFGIFDAIKNDYFPKGSKITCLHTGGLQGNLSLPANHLIF